MVPIVKGLLIRRRVISKEQGELAREQGCNPAYSHPSPNAGIIAPAMFNVSVHS